METTKSIVIGATPKALYQICTDLESLPTRVESLRSVERTGEKTSHWVAKGPTGKELEWDSEWTVLEPGKRIAWRTVDHGNVKTSGQVTFTSLPHDQTELTLMLKMLSDELPEARENAEKLIDESLRSLKTSLEKR